MAAPNGLNDLATRKRLLIAEAAAHREAIASDQFALEAEIRTVRDRVWANRWWVLGGAVVAGILVMRVGVQRLIPAGLLAWRVAAQARRR